MTGMNMFVVYATTFSAAGSVDVAMTPRGALVVEPLKLRLGHTSRKTLTVTIMTVMVALMKV